jgi:predicted GH43/DUF377 family glycosyl hydrolase
VLARSEGPFLLPELPWEKTGNVPNVIFVEGAVEDTEGQITAYYGGADKYIGAMKIKISYQ